MKEKILLPLAVFFILILSGSVYAQVSYFPQQFYGDVIINGVPAPDGVLISAKHDGKDVEGGLTAGGKYGYDTPAFIVALHSSYEGDTLVFYVQNVKAAEYPFTAGESTRLDLTVTIPNFCGDGKCEAGESCSSCSKDCGACTPPSGGGGGGGGGSSGGTTGGTTGSNQTGPCVEEWICTDWTECFNGIQKRTCADVSRCGTNTSKPIEKQTCIMPLVCTPGEKKCNGNILNECSTSGTTWFEVETCENGCLNNKCLEESFWSANLFTGMLVGMPVVTIGGIIVVIIIAVLLALYFVKWRK